MISLWNIFIFCRVIMLFNKLYLCLEELIADVSHECEPSTCQQNDINSKTVNVPISGMYGFYYI